MATLNVELQPYLAERMQYLISRQNNNTEYLFRDFVEYKISELERAIFNIEKDLRKYEKKYRLSSQKFFQQFEAGKFGDEDDYMVWSGIYELYQKNKNELSKLQW